MDVDQVFNSTNGENNGHNQAPLAGNKRKAFMGGSDSYCSTLCTWWVIVLCFLSLTGCSTLKTALMTGAATTAVVGATSVLPGGVIVPALAGGATAVTVSALTAEKQVKGDSIEVTADTVVQEAPDNFWTLLGKLVATSGWAIGLIILVPMLFSLVSGWLIPGPVKLKGIKKKKK